MLETLTKQYQSVKKVAILFSRRGIWAHRFFCLFSGSSETPFTAAAMFDDNMDMLKLLVQYGAYLDFRTKAGKTALHNVAIIGKEQTLKVCAFIYITTLREELI